MIELKGTTSWYPDLNIECLTFLLFLPSHTEVQWLKFKHLNEVRFFITVAGAVLDLHQLPKAEAIDLLSLRAV